MFQFRWPTWVIEPPSRSDNEHSAGNSEQYPSPILPIEPDERAQCISRKEERKRMRPWQPAVSPLRHGCGGYNYTLEDVECVQEQGCVDWVRGREGQRDLGERP